MEYTFTTNNPFSLISLFSALCYLFVFAKTWGQKRGTRIHKAFLLFSFDYFLIVLFEYIYKLNLTIQLSTFFAHLAMALLLLSGFLMMNLIYAFIERKIDLLYKILLVNSVVGALTLFIPGLLILSFDKQEMTLFVKPSHVLSVIFFISTIIPAVLSVYVGIKQFFRTGNKKEKRILKLFLTGLTISILFGFLFLVLFPFIFNDHLQIFYEFSSLSVIFLLVYLYKAVNEYYLKIINYSELEQVSASLFSKVEEAVIILGPFGDIVDYNSGARKLLGDIKYSKEIEDKIENYSTNQNYNDYKTKLKSNEGDLFISINQTEVEREENVLGKLIIIKDVTKEEQYSNDQKRLELQVQKAEKLQAIGQLAGGIAHDFNNQLAAIMGCADLLLEEVEDNQYLKELAENIIKSSKRAGGLTQQLLAFAQKGKYLSCAVDVHNTINDVMSFLSRSIDKKIEIETKLLASENTVSGDPSQLNNVFLNLALNARDAMSGSGKISFNTENCQFKNGFHDEINESVTDGEYLKIEVIDNGCGIPTEIQNKIFDPFFTTKGLGNGTGMGLAAVYGTIKNHNGYITFKSSLNKGTIFSIYLPISEQKSEIINISRIDNDKSENPKSKGTILIIDDEKIVNLTATKTLQKIGYNTVSFHNSEEALVDYEKNYSKYDAIILDLIMPQIDGYQMFEFIRKINPEASVLIASGYSLDNKTQQLLDKGAKGFIQKPFRKDELKSKLLHIFNEES